MEDIAQSLIKFINIFFYQTC